MNLEQARFNMIEQQIRPWEVLDERVLNCFEEVHRDLFVDEQYQNLAYADYQLPINDQEKMFPPVVEGRMLQALAIQPGDMVFEIGTGSGYITACLAALGKQVLSYEVDTELLQQAQERLDKLGYNNINIENGDAFSCCDFRERFDVICITGALHQIPECFYPALTLGGRMFCVVGDSPVMQALLITREDEQQWSVTRLFETDLPYCQDQNSCKDSQPAN